MLFFIPKDTVFQEIEKLNRTLLLAGEEIEKLPDGFPGSIKDRAQRILALEKESKELKRMITDEIDRTFITPLDREDLHILAVSLVAILDHAGNAASNLDVYGVRVARQPLADFCTTVNSAIKACVTSVRVLRQHKRLDNVQAHLREIRTLEVRGDDLLRQSLQDLFASEQDAREIIKWKDIFQSFERSLDRAEDTADVLEGILIKNT